MGTSRFQPDGRYAITKFPRRSIFLLIILFSPIILFGRIQLYCLSLILLFVQSLPSLFPLSLARPLRRFMRRRRRRYDKRHDL